MAGAPQPPYRYNERALQRAYADNCTATREFLMANYVRFGRIFGTHGNGGMSRARRAVTFLMEGPLRTSRGERSRKRMPESVASVRVTSRHVRWRTEASSPAKARAGTARRS